METSYFRFGLVFLLNCVSVFGLCSCHSDTSRTDDNWQLRPPTVDRQDGTKIPFRDLGLQPISGDSTLSFSDSDTSGVKFKIDESCQTPWGVVGQTDTLISVAEIPLKSLWPREIWLKLDASGIEKTVCSFHFTATDSVGSTQDFEIANVRLKNIAKSNIFIASGNAEIKPLSEANKPTANNTFEIQALDANSLSLDFPSASENQTNYSLFCENFENHRTSPDRYIPENLIHDLFSGNLASIDGTPAPATDPTLDPRVLKTRQTCHILREEKETATHLTKYETSSTFQLVYPMEPINSSIAFSTGDGMATTQTFFTLELKNPSPKTIALRFPKAPGKSIYFQIITGTADGKFVAGPPRGQSLTTKVTGATQLQSLDDDFVFQIPTQGSVKITTFYHANAYCLAIYPVITDLNYLRWSEALTYAYDQPFQIRQYRDWDDAVQNFDGELVDVTSSLQIPMPIKPATDRLLQGWLPFTNWQVLKHDPKIPKVGLIEYPSTDKAAHNCIN